MVINPVHQTTQSCPASPFSQSPFPPGAGAGFQHKSPTHGICQGQQMSAVGCDSCAEASPSGDIRQEACECCRARHPRIWHPESS